MATPERIPLTNIEILPIVDRVVSAALWAGRLVTRQFGHQPPTHGDHLFIDRRDDGEQPRV